MRKPILLTIALLLVASAGYSQMADMTKTITAKEKEMYEAIKTDDMKTFEANLAENYMSVSATGISDRAKELKDIKNLKMDSYELSDISVMQPAKGVAVITYMLNASGMWKQEQFSGKYYASSTWVMSDNKWRAVMHTETQAAPMEEPVGMEQ